MPHQAPRSVFVFASLGFGAAECVLVPERTDWRTVTKCENNDHLFGLGLVGQTIFVKLLAYAWDKYLCLRIIPEQKAKHGKRSWEIRPFAENEFHSSFQQNWIPMQNVFQVAKIARISKQSSRIGNRGRWSDPDWSRHWFHLYNVHSAFVSQNFAFWKCTTNVNF